MSNINEPIEYIGCESENKKPEKGIALCLSGGGYRAMLFHTGVLWRLFESGYLHRLERISSVSGGSVTAGVLGLAWESLSQGSLPDNRVYVQHVVEPICRIASKTIDVPSIIKGILFPGSINEKIQDYYKKYLFGDSTLQDLPDKPRFVFNATNVQSGVLWRFSKPYMRDYRVGEIRQPRVLLAEAIGASSAFPPVLSPMVMSVDPKSFTPGSGTDLERIPFTSQVVLTDGGVYDNLGLETAWKRYDTILVSDAGGKMMPQESPKKDWAQNAFRVLNLVDNQVRSLRKRQLIDAFENRIRKGTYWGIRTDIANYELPDPLPCPYQQTLKLANTPTRLKSVPMELQQRLMNWGYAVCDAAIRKHLDPAIPKPINFPFPSVGV